MSFTKDFSADELKYLPTYAQGQIPGRDKKGYGFDVGTVEDFYGPQGKYNKQHLTHEGYTSDMLNADQAALAKAIEQYGAGAQMARGYLDIPNSKSSYHATYKLDNGQWTPVSGYTATNSFKDSLLKFGLGAAALFTGGAALAGMGAGAGAGAVGGTGISAGAAGSGASGLYGLGGTATGLGSTGLGAGSALTVGEAAGLAGGTGLIASPAVQAAWTSAALGGGGMSALDYAKKGYDLYSKGKKVYNAYNQLTGAGGPGGGQGGQGMARGVPGAPSIAGGAAPGGLGGGWRMQGHVGSGANAMYAPIAQDYQRQQMADWMRSNPEGSGLGGY